MRLLTDEEIEEATGKSTVPDPEIPGGKFWVGDELKVALAAQDDKTAAAMQKELDEVAQNYTISIASLGIVVKELDALRENAQELAEALAALTLRYTGLVTSGDCGNWDPETEEQVKRSRAALE